MRFSLAQAPDIAHLPAQPQAVAAARLPADDRAIARALGVARQFGEAAGLGPDGTQQLAIVVEEWLANLVEHGELAPGSLIVMRLEREPACVRMTVTDAGVFFDPRDAILDGPRPERGGGAGLALIRAWSRVVAYARRGGRNRLELEVSVARGVPGR